MKPNIRSLRKLFSLPEVGVTILSLLLLLGIGFNLAGCRSVTPGADPFVVRVEQTQKTADATIDLVLHMDHADRGFWKTNAPAFHKFCETLRTPVNYNGTNVSRVVAAEINVQDLKTSYKFAKTEGNSNALFTAWSVLNTFVSQAASWSNIVSTPSL